jgi:hypothetical protein
MTPNKRPMLSVSTRLTLGLTAVALGALLAVAVLAAPRRPGPHL